MELRGCTEISYTMSFSLFCFLCCLPLAKGPLLAYGRKSASEARLGAPHTPAPTKSDWPCRQASFISRGGTSQATSAPARGPQGCCLCTTMTLLDLLSSQIMLSCPHFSVVVQRERRLGTLQAWWKASRREWNPGTSPCFGLSSYSTWNLSGQARVPYGSDLKLSRMSFFPLLS